MATQTVDLRPQVVNVKVTRGDKWWLAVTWPGSLVGLEVRGQVRDEPDDDESTPLVIVVTDAEAGKFFYGQDGATNGYYDIEVGPPGGLGRTYVKGKIQAEGDVTRV